MGSQVDIGYDLLSKTWFLQCMTEMRILRGNVSIKDNKLGLSNVVCDTFAYAESDQVSHGRLRFYEGNEITTKGDSGLFAETVVDGKNPDPISFMELKGDFTIKYNVKSMDWTISIKGNNYITKNIIGKLTGDVNNDPIRFRMKKAKILYSTIVTLVNVGLEIPKIT